MSPTPLWSVNEENRTIGTVLGERMEHACDSRLLPAADEGGEERCVPEMPGPEHKVEEHDAPELKLEAELAVLMSEELLRKECSWPASE